MRIDKFNNVIKLQVEQCLDTLTNKSIEYNKDSNERLDCFKRAANLSGTTVLEAVAGMMMKHTISIYQMINDGKTHSLDKWNEKITDHINYLLILWAAILDEAEINSESREGEQ